MSLTLKEALATLGINDSGDHPPKLKFVQKRFYQLLLVHHPDKPGGDNATQQKLAEPFKFLANYIVENYAISDDTEEEMARHVYTNSNMENIKENIFSFTIKIENNHSLIWDSVLSDHYGLPLDRKANGKHWKHLNYSDDNFNTS